MSGKQKLQAYQLSLDKIGGKNIWVRYIQTP